MAVANTKIPMNDRKEHITICICTHKRPRQLKNLLEHIFKQETDGLFDISVSIVDNDIELSAKPVIDDFLKEDKGEIRYTHAPDKNLALLRNLSVDNSRGEYVAFIDDDEYPFDNWLLLLHKTMNEFQADGVLGPIVPEYQEPPPRWVEKGKLCERPRFKTGSYLDWQQTRTGNALLKRNLFINPDNLFDLKYKLGAEDDALFRKLIDKGYAFVWCDEAIVYEEVPADRLTLTYFMKRSRLIGFMSYYYYKDTRSSIKNIIEFFKSCVALVIYLILLPLFLAWGYHHFANLMIRIHYHKAIIMTFMGALKIEKRDI